MAVQIVGSSGHWVERSGQVVAFTGQTVTLAVAGQVVSNCGHSVCALGQTVSCRGQTVA
jgi:hypothetical protein